MEESKVLDAYLAAPRKRAALRRMISCDPEPVQKLQRAAVRRYATGTLTLTELTLFAHDLAAVCSTGEARRLYLDLAPIEECCVRNANVEAKELLQGWFES